MYCNKPHIWANSDEFAFHPCLVSRQIGILDFTGSYELRCLIIHVRTQFGIVGFAGAVFTRQGRRSVQPAFTPGQDTQAMMKGFKGGGDSADTHRATKSKFFGFGSKKKSNKPEYTGDMKHGKACGKVCFCACCLPAPLLDFSILTCCRQKSCTERGLYLTSTIRWLACRGAAHGRTGTRMMGIGRIIACMVKAYLCGSKSRVDTRARYFHLRPFFSIDRSWFLRLCLSCCSCIWD